MTELKVGKIHLRSYTSPIHWKVFTRAKSKKNPGMSYEKLVGWLGTLPQALDKALQQHLAASDAQSIGEVKELIEEFQKEVLDALKG